MTSSYENEKNATQNRNQALKPIPNINLTLASTDLTLRALVL
jgi:hypothetical protein